MNEYFSTYFEVAAEVAVDGEVENEDSIDDTAKQRNKKAKAKGNCQWSSIDDVSEKMIELTPSEKWKKVFRFLIPS